MAPNMAETALHIGKTDRAGGRDVGRAALDYTSGINPAKIGKTANESISNLQSKALSAIEPGKTMSLFPVRQAGEAGMSDINAENVPSLINAGRGLQDVLNTSHATGEAIPEMVGPSQAMALRRGLGRYLPEGTWNPETSSRIAPLRNQMYGAMNNQIGDAFPEIREADKPVTSLIPVARHAESLSREAPLMQRVAGRVAARTGALTGAGIGGYAGYKEGGMPGAIVGGLTGAVAPELIADPAGQMAAARLMNKASGLRPLVGSALQLTRKKDDQ
jgi:hypothetical protein